MHGTNHAARKIFAVVLTSAFICTTIVPTDSLYALAPASGTQNPLIRSECLLTALSQSGSLVFTDSVDDIRFRRGGDDTDGPLAILAAPHLRRDPVALVRAIIREEVRAVLEIMAQEDDVAYGAVRDAVLALPHIRARHAALLPADERGLLTGNALANDMLARSLELIISLAPSHKIIRRGSLTGEERAFLDTTSPFITSHRYEYFTRLFWDIGLREIKIRIALASGLPLTHCAAPAPSPTRPEPAAAAPAPLSPQAIVDLDKADDLTAFGAKAFFLRMLRELGHEVPEGFALSQEVYEAFLATTGLGAKIAAFAAKIEDRVRGETGLSEAITLAEELRREIADARLSPEIDTALRAAYRRLVEQSRIAGGLRVAVRSSGIGEDAQDTAFAGQHATILNITSEDAYIKAIKACWASLFSLQAVQYRLKKGLKITDARMGVVVQEMIPSDVSGIAFSVNPQTNDPYETIITSAYGLCEGVVDGTVPVDTICYDVHSRTLNPYRSTIVTKETMVAMTADGGTGIVPVEPSLREQRTLSDTMAERVAETVLALSKTLGAPVEMEWAVYHGRLILLQVRPITTLSEKTAFPIRWEEPTDREKLWFFEPQLGEYSTLEASRVRYINEGIRRCEETFLDPVSFRRKPFNNYIYMSLVLREMNAVQKLRYGSSLLLQKALRFTRALYLPLQHRLPFLPTPSAIFDRFMWERFLERLLPALRSGAEEMRAMRDGASTDDYATLYRHYQRYNELLSDFYLMHQQINGLSYPLLTIGGTIPKSDLITMLNAGVDTVTTAITDRVWEISRLVRRDKTLADLLRARSIEARRNGTTVPVDGLDATPEGAAFSALLAGFIREHGNRASTLRTPTWAEDTTGLVRWILELSAEDDGALTRKREQLRIAHRETRERILAATHPLKRFWRAYQLAAFSNMARVTDDHNYYIEQTLAGGTRQFLMVVADRLVGEGILQRRDDIFFLTDDELQALLRDLGGGVTIAPGPVQTLVAERHATYDRNAAITPPTKIGAIHPRSVFIPPQSKGTTIAGLALEGKMTQKGFTGESFVGMPASPGIVEGPVRIITSMDEFGKVGRGEILVCKETAPPWSALFTKIAGIVTDEGRGILQHTAITAREFGIPAVIETKDATRLLKDGAIVRVDGTNGTVQDLGFMQFEPGAFVIPTATAGDIQTGIPPGTIKTAMLNGRDVPTVYVLPDTFYRDDVNYADAEFPIYFNFFVKHRKTVIVGDERSVERIRTILNETLFGPAGCPDYLQREMDLLAVHEGFRPDGRKLDLEDFVEFIPFRNATAQINGVTIFREDASRLRFEQDGRTVATVDTAKEFRPAPEPVVFPEEPLQIPELGCTLLGTSTGFDPKGLTTSFITWWGGKGMVVDPLAKLSTYIEAIGIAPDDVPDIFLSHVHGDHDAGLLEWILHGHRVNLITSRLIYESFLRKARAITGQDFSHLVHFVEARPGETLAWRGGELEFAYGIHSIPSLSFRLTYRGKVIAYSGDTRYDPVFFDSLVAQGKMTTERKAELENFLFEKNPELIIHEAGGAPLHTVPDVLEKHAPEQLRERLLVVHTGKLPDDVRLTLGNARQTWALAELDAVTRGEREELTARTVSLFDGVDEDRIFTVVRQATRREYVPGETIVREGDDSRDVYIITSGEAAVLKNVEGHDQVVAHLTKGDYFGEMAPVLGIPRTATVQAISRITVYTLRADDFLQTVGGSALHERLGRIMTLRPFLSDLPLLRHVPPKELAFLATRLGEQHRMRGDVVIRQGEVGDAFYLMRSGTVRITARDTDGAERVIREEHAGDCFGEIALLRDLPRTATVTVASDNAEILRLSRQDFLALNHSCPAIAFALTQLVEERLGGSSSLTAGTPTGGISDDQPDASDDPDEASLAESAPMAEPAATPAPPVPDLPLIEQGRPTTDIPEEVTFADALRECADALGPAFGTQVARLSGKSVTPPAGGESLILYADDLLEHAAVIDLEHTVKNILARQNILTGGKVVLFARSGASAAILARIIGRAAPAIDLVTITADELQTGGDEAREVDALIRLARARGAREILALIKGPTKAPEELVRVSRNIRVPIVLIGSEKGFYSFAQALAAAIAIKEANGARGWLIMLPPLKIISKELQVRYEHYLRSFEALRAA